MAMNNQASVSASNPHIESEGDFFVRSRDNCMSNEREPENQKENPRMGGASEEEVKEDENNTFLLSSVQRKKENKVERFPVPPQ